MRSETTANPAITERRHEQSPKVAVIVASVHHGNTLRIAEVVADTMGAELLTTSELCSKTGQQYDCVAFGSGIYFGRHHKSILQLAESMEQRPPAVILYSTAGLPWLSHWFHWPLRRRLRNRGCRVIGEFCCRGWDTVGPLFLMGGINRSHPSQKDLHNAQSFATRMVQQLTANQ